MPTLSITCSSGVGGQAAVGVVEFIRLIKHPCKRLMSFWDWLYVLSQEARSCFSAEARSLCSSIRSFHLKVKTAFSPFLCLLLLLFYLKRLVSKWKSCQPPEETTRGTSAAVAQCHSTSSDTWTSLNTACSDSLGLSLRISGCLPEWRDAGSEEFRDCCNQIPESAR